MAIQTKVSLQSKQQPPVQADGVAQTYDFVDYYDLNGNLIGSVDSSCNEQMNSYSATMNPATGAATATATSGTIATSTGVARVSPAAAITGVILAPGTYGGQFVTVVNNAVAANSVTFAAAGTSNVADGVSSVIAGLNARRFVWDSIQSLWYPCK